MEKPRYKRRSLHLGKGEDDGDERSNDARTQHALRLDGVAGLTAGNEHFADGVHQQVEGDGEDGGIEEGTVAKDGCSGRETHEGDVAEGRHEAQLAATVLVGLAPDAGDKIGKGEDDGIVDHRNPHQTDNLLAAEDKAVAHDTRKDEHRARHVEHEVRHLLVEVGLPEPEFGAEETHHDDAEKQQHLLQNV